MGGRQGREVAGQRARLGGQAVVEASVARLLHPGYELSPRRLLAPWHLAAGLGPVRALHGEQCPETAHVDALTPA